MELNKPNTAQGYIVDKATEDAASILEKSRIASPLGNFFL